ncbi:phospholipase D-like domain-containing protein [Halodurantibacterium flavum]|uniref:Phospholipase D n=1 Tax=Halodurantibacterium flavum TaxID=1382802 RepID=A0ABW4SAD2_9RHOB
MNAKDPVLRVGQTCWRMGRAERVAVIVDAADYFATVRAAVLKAQHSVMMIGWDFDTRIALLPGQKGLEGPNRLGRFLSWVVKTRPDLRVYVLRWDLGVVMELKRGSTPLFVLNWMTSRRMRLVLDHVHPPMAAHHQKIITIDDTLAFCGGIDMTADRWDTRSHRDDEPYRVRPTSRRRYKPWHDVATAVEGEVAKALGELARSRWERATGERLDPPPPLEGAWPEGLQTTFTDVDVAIARTVPDHEGHTGAREIEALYLAAIARCRRTLYIESQYFASRRIADAMAARLSEPDPPEIVVINPESADGWLQEEVMGSSRARLLQLVRRADHKGRFRIYTPVTKGGQPIYVHAKVLVMDDRLLRVGSSNLNNRSMGFDSECDLALEAGADDVDLRGQIVGVRDDLLAEHLGVDEARLRAALDQGSLIAAIEVLRGEGRTLVPFDPPDLNGFEEEVMAENALLDPESTAAPRRSLRGWIRGLWSWRKRSPPLRP